MIFIGLGANIGPRQFTLQHALDYLRKAGAIPAEVSSWHETPPWGVANQPPFLNGVARLEFSGDARSLMELLLATETALGRVRSQKWGPRILDLDLLEFRREIHDEPDLKVPHPWYPSRGFVLAPFAEIAPYWIPTGMRVSVTSLLQGLELEKTPSK